jgi:hypothetical protein
MTSLQCGICLEDKLMPKASTERDRILEWYRPTTKHIQVTLPKIVGTPGLEANVQK